MLIIGHFYPCLIQFQTRPKYKKDNSFAKINNSISRDSIKDNLSTTTENSFSDSSETNPNSDYNQKNILLNISEKEMKEAFFVPKKLRQNNKKEENIAIKNDLNINNINENQNTDVLKIEIKISKSKVLYLKFGKSDNVYEVVNKFCKENNLDYISRFIIISNVLKGLNSIYSIYNLNLREDEIQFIKELKEKYMLMNRI